MELDNLQLEIGELAPVLSLNFKKFSYRATSYWILTLWRFISDNQFGLCSFANVHLFPLRENDCSIMSCFDNLNIYNKQELKTLNNFHMFLQVTSLADITIGDSKFIREMIRLGRHQVDWKGNLDWGIQCPTRSNFNLWRKAIKNITFGENGRLLQYLGNVLYMFHTSTGKIRDMTKIPFIAKVPLLEGGQPEISRTFWYM